MGRKKYSKELKSQIALDAIKGQKTIAELASEYGVHANQISIWKKQLLDAAPAAFSNGKDKDAEKKEVERDHLYKKIGQLQIEVDWLKKDRLSGMSVSGKVKCIDGNDKKLSISRQCELLQLPRSSYYRPRSSLAEGPDNLVLIRTSIAPNGNFAWIEFNGENFVWTREGERIDDYVIVSVKMGKIKLELNGRVVKLILLPEKAQSVN